jgi:hypothetical protein
MRVNGSHGGLNPSSGIRSASEMGEMAKPELGPIFLVICFPSFLGFGMGIWLLVLTEGLRPLWLGGIGVLSVGFLLAGVYGSALWIQSYLERQQVILEEELQRVAETFIQLSQSGNEEVESTPRLSKPSRDQGRFFLGNELLIISKEDGPRGLS